MNILEGGNIMNVFRVAAQSPARALAGAIAKTLRTHGRVELQAVGAAAVNQAAKATAIARGFLEQDGLDIVLIPALATVMIDDQEKSAIRFVVEAR